MKKLCLLLAGLAISSSAHAQMQPAQSPMRDPNAQIGASDMKMDPAMKGQAVDAKSFVEKASSGNEFEIQSSRLALEKSSNADVKAFAQQMIDDHTKAGERMKAALSKGNLTAVPDMRLDMRHQATVDGMRQAGNGADFDKAYIASQLEAHQSTVSLFRNYSQNGDNAELKSFAKMTLPSLEMHLSHVEKLSKGMMKQG